MDGLRGSWALWSGVARTSFRRYATYRAATLAGIFTNSVFGVINAYVLTAVWAASPGAGGYDTRDAVTYVWIAQGLIAVVAVWSGGSDVDLAQRIRSGDVVTDLQRPVSLMGWYLAADLGRAGFALLSRGVAPIVVGALIFDLRRPHGWAIVLVAVAVVLAVLVSFGLRMLVALSTFWILDDTGVRTALAFLSTFFSGLTLPLVLLPHGLREIAFALPFAGYMQLPADLWIGRRTGWSALGGLGLAALWTVVLLGLCTLVLRRATRRVVLQGG